MVSSGKGRYQTSLLMLPDPAVTVGTTEHEVTVGPRRAEAWLEKVLLLSVREIPEGSDGWLLSFLRPELWSVEGPVLSPHLLIYVKWLGRTESGRGCTALSSVTFPCSQVSGRDRSLGESKPAQDQTG